MTLPESGEIEDEDVFRLRSYQQEMVQASLKRNVIVALDTGSGKTAIAIARAQYALETSPPEKLVWFLAPTVPLCRQQSREFEKRLPAYPLRTICGDDLSDTWKSKSIWDAVLDNIRIVVSTHQVLLDALTHGFISLTRVVLLVFDEAHHCTKKHPANQIMDGFYRALLHKGLQRELPAILGLSASPVINSVHSTKSGLDAIEANLHAQVVTPRRHRAELSKYVHQPLLTSALYRQHEVGPVEPDKYPALTALSKLRACDISGQLTAIPGLFDQFLDQEDMSDVIWFCRKTIDKLCDRVFKLGTDIGLWPAENFVKTFIGRFSSPLTILPSAGAFANSLRNHSIATLFKGFYDRDIATRNAIPIEPTVYRVSSKSQVLIDTLVREWTADFKGLIFVKERASTTALAHLIGAHPETRDKFDVSPYVGMSQSAKKTDITDFFDFKEQEKALHDFRHGKKNVLVTTTVLEEGIDVPECHIVICFDPPDNLKQFIQRRGRARKQDSKYIVLLSETDIAAKPAKWQALEETMRMAYLNDKRIVREAQELESADEEANRKFRVAATGALLTMSNAVQHLYHFCSSLSAGSYIDARPYFTFHDDGGNVRGEVCLPAFVPQHLRVAQSSQGWLTEANARRDAAFEAYVALYKAGLVNDNLVPFNWLDTAQSGEDEKLIRGIESVRVDPWLPSAKRISGFDGKPKDFEWHRYVIEIVANDSSRLISVFMLTAVLIPPVPDFTLYWNETVEYRISIRPQPKQAYTEKKLTAIRSITQTILRNSQPGRMRSDRTDFLTLFLPKELGGRDIYDYAEHVAGNTKLLTLFDAIGANDIDSHVYGVLRGDKTGRCLPKRFEVGENGPDVVCLKMPKRRDFVHRLENNKERESYTAELRLPCDVDAAVEHLPLNYAIFGYLLPSILNRVELTMIADELRTTLLAPVGIGLKWAKQVQYALNHGSAGESIDYERLEFLGDCMLKFLVTLQVLVDHPLWPEGYLNKEKAKLVSNNHLAVANIKRGVYKYVNLTRFTGARWRVRYVEDVLADAAQASEERPAVEEQLVKTAEMEGPNDEEEEQEQRSEHTAAPGSKQLSMKMLADVVESLTGASYLHSGFQGAQECLKVFFPEQTWTDVSTCVVRLRKESSAGPEPKKKVVLHLEGLEELLGHTFRNKSLLLEAVTHDSFHSPGGGTDTRSYQRLEFLGDAVLDTVVTQKLFAARPRLPYFVMDKMRAALVNTWVLGFLCMEHGVLVPRKNVVAVIEGSSTPPPSAAASSSDSTPPTPAGTAEATAAVYEEVHDKKALWQFLRYDSHALTQRRAAQEQRYARLRVPIRDALLSAPEYPWLALSQLAPDKVFADVVEASVGAIYLDSGGAIAAVEAFLDRIGLLPLLDRFVADSVRCEHPKSLLQTEAVPAPVAYEIEKAEGEETTATATATAPAAPPAWRARVKVGDGAPGPWFEAPSKVDAETAAAHDALLKLREERRGTDVVMEE